MSPALRPASGQGTPSNRRTGRKLTYWSNSRRNFNSEPQRDVVGNRCRPADRAEIDCVHAVELGLPVLGHHHAGLGIVVATRPFDVGEIEPETETARSC